MGAGGLTAIRKPVDVFPPAITPSVEFIFGLSALTSNRSDAIEQLDSRVEWPAIPAWFHPGQFEWQLIASTVRYWSASFRFRTKIALPIGTLELNLLMNQ
jgi:hypothetical protein